MLTMDSLLQALPHIKAGRLKALAVLGPKRIARCCPTCRRSAESGLPGYALTNWFGLLVPAATPKEIVLKVHSRCGEGPAGRRSPQADLRPGRRRGRQHARGIRRRDARRVGAVGRDHQVGEHQGRMKIYILDAFHPAGPEYAARHFEVVRWDDPKVKSWAEEADGVMVRMTPIRAADLARAKKVKVICKQGVGFDTIDIAAAAKHGIPVLRTPGVNSEAVAEMAMALALVGDAARDRVRQAAARRREDRAAEDPRRRDVAEDRRRDRHGQHRLARGAQVAGRLRGETCCTTILTSKRANIRRSLAGRTAARRRTW